MIDIEAYNEFCNEHICSKCPYNRDDNFCLPEWAYQQGRADGVDEFVCFANTMPTVENEDGEIRPMRLEEMAEQVKENKNG